MMKKEIVSDGETAVKKENPWKRFNPVSYTHLIGIHFLFRLRMAD